MTEQQAAIQETRNAMIKAGILHATRLRELRSQNKDYDIAVSTSGGLALIQTKGTAEHPSGVLRFGAIHSKQVASLNHRDVARWNQKAPEHPVELRSLQRTLESECFRIFLLLHEIEENIKRTEG